MTTKKTAAKKAPAKKRAPAKKAAAKKAGRPSLLTQQMSNTICGKLSEGQSLQAICEEPGMPDYATVKRWERDNATFRADSLRAREIGCHRIAEDCLRIADDARNDWMERRGQDDAGWVANGEHIQRSKLRIDTRLRLLGKWLPKVYGDKIAIGGAEDLPPVKHDVSLTPDEAYLRMIGK